MRSLYFARYEFDETVMYPYGGQIKNNKMPFKTQQKRRLKITTTFHKSKRIIHQKNHPERYALPQTARHLLPSFLSSSLLLSHSFSSSSSLPLTHTRARALSLFPSLSLSLCLSFSPLSPRPVCMNNVLPFVMRARGGKKTGWSVRPLRALTLKMNDSLPECQSSSD